MIHRRLSPLPAVILAGLLSGAALLGPATTAAASPSAAAAEIAAADTVYSLLNDARWANGQAGLLRNAALDQVAAAWAEKLAAAGTLSHNPSYSAQIPAGWSNAGENVAQGQPDAGAMHAAWMASPGHRDNILGSYSDVGIAFLSAGGTTWGVQVFATYSGHVGPSAPGTVGGSQVAESPAPGEPTEAEVTAVAPTPEATAESSAATEVVAARTEDGALSRWWMVLVAGAVGVAGAAFWVLRRRRRAAPQSRAIP